MRLLLGSNIYGQSGYAKSMRELGVALREVGIETVSGQPVPSGVFCSDKHQCLHSGQVQAQKGDTFLFRAYFDTTPKPVKGIHFIAFIALESTKLPEKMVRECNLEHIDQVWVPSEHCKRYAIESGILEDKIRVVPHGYDPTIFKTNKKKESLQGFTFLFVGGYTGRGDRKGADLLAEAFKEEFKPEEKVQLKFKINTSYGPFPIYDLAIDPRIKIDVNNYQDKDMVQIYNICDCFVSPSYGEAFNMTVLEALACGLPVITSSWGGQKDYINSLPNRKERTVFGILYDYPPIPARYSPWDVGSWAKPNFEDIKSNLREVYQKKPPVKKYKGIEQWTWKEAALKAKKCLEEL